jgi:hypothetical protein
VFANGKENAVLEKMFGKKSKKDSYYYNQRKLV